MNLDPVTLSEKIIHGRGLTPAAARGLARANLWDVLYAAHRVRRAFKKNAVRLCSIVNAKSGACPEDCSFCAQSSRHRTGAPRYPLLKPAEIVTAFRRAVADGASCFGIVTSGRSVSQKEIGALCRALRALPRGKATLSVSLGELTAAQFARLKAAGLERYHHNLETSERFFPRICTTHSYPDRLATVRRARAAGLSVCCGGLFGLGESPADRVALAFALRDARVDSVPLNFLHPVPGTPLAGREPLDPFEILRTIALFRLILPRADIGVCGGREVNLREYQPLIFFAGANGMMTGGYLTTPGSPSADDRRMVREAGFTIWTKKPRS